MVEGVVEVVRASEPAFAVDVLVDAAVVGARALRPGRRDVILGDVGRVARLLQLGVEAGELDAKGRLLHAGGRVGAQQRAVEPLVPGRTGSIGEADARRLR